ncbi:MAG: Ribosome recycling factor, partial [uncultured Sphingomonadaceae bacterium]
ERRGGRAQARPPGPAHRPGERHPARSGERRGLRRADAAQPVGDRVRAGAAAHLRPGLGPLQRRPRRQGDPRGGARPQPDRRRADAAAADPRLDAGAAQGARQARLHLCGEGARGGAQRAPRRHGRAQGGREEGRDRRGRAQAARGRRAEAHGRNDRRHRQGGVGQGKGNPRPV